MQTAAPSSSGLRSILTGHVFPVVSYQPACRWWNVLEINGMALKDAKSGLRNEAGIAAVLGILKQSFGERFQTGESFRAQHAHTTTYIPAQLPDGVLFAETADDVKAAVRVCAEHKVP